MDKINYSGIQLIYEAVSPTALHFADTDERCRICGGPLTEDSADYKKAISDSWTDETTCRSKESNHLCVACNFFTTGSNKMTVWNKHSVIVASDKFQTLAALTYTELLDFLRSDIVYPAVIALKGTDSSITKKHVEWKSINAVSYCDQKIRVAFSGLQIFKESKIDGVAEFDKNDFLILIENFKKITEKYIMPIMSKMKSEWQKRNFIFSQLVNVLQLEDNYCFTPTVFLAALLTGCAMTDTRKTNTNQ